MHWAFYSFHPTRGELSVTGLKICSASKSQRRKKCNKEFYRRRLTAKTCLLLFAVFVHVVHMLCVKNIVLAFFVRQEIIKNISLWTLQNPSVAQNQYRQRWCSKLYIFCQQMAGEFSEVDLRISLFVRFHQSIRLFDGARTHNWNQNCNKNLWKYLPF